MTPWDLPESLPRTPVMAFIKALGLEPADVQRLEFGPFGLYVDLVARNDAGRPMSDGFDAAVHRIFIRFTEEGGDDDRAAAQQGPAADQP